MGLSRDLGKRVGGFRVPEGSYKGFLDLEAEKPSPLRIKAGPKSLYNKVLLTPSLRARNLPSETPKA